MCCSHDCWSTGRRFLWDRNHLSALRRIVRNSRIIRTFIRVRNKRPCWCQRSEWAGWLVLQDTQHRITNPEALHISIHWTLSLVPGTRCVYPIKWPWSPSSTTNTKKRNMRHQHRNSIAVLLFIESFYCQLSSSLSRQGGIVFISFYFFWGSKCLIAVPCWVLLLTTTVLLWSCSASLCITLNEVMVSSEQSSPFNVNENPVTLDEKAVHRMVKISNYNINYNIYNNNNRKNH